MKTQILLASLASLFVQTAAFAQGAPSLPPGKYSYFGVDGNQTPLSFTIGADGVVKWNTPPQTGSTEAPLRAGVARENELQPPSANVIKFPLRDVPEFPGASIEMTATFGDKGVNYDAFIYNVPRPVLADVFFLDGNRMEICHATSGAESETMVPGSYNPKTGNANIEMRGFQVLGPGQAGQDQFAKIRDFTMRVQVLEYVREYNPFSNPLWYNPDAERDKRMERESRKK